MDDNWMSNNTSAPDPAGYTEIRPWARFWARVTDYILFETAVILVIFLCAGTIDNKTTIKLLHLVVLFAWVPVEAFLLSVIGTTPGKWLLGVVVRDEYGMKPSFNKALKRSLLVWLYGMWAGLPYIYWVGLIRSMTKLTKDKTTAWDKKSCCSVRHEYYRPLKIFAAFLIIGSVIATSYANIYKNIQAKPSDSYSNTYFDSLDRVTDILGSNAKITYSPMARALNEQGSTLLDAGEYAEAKEVLLQGLAEKPDIEAKNNLYCNLSVACYALGEYSESLDYIQKSLTIFPNSTEEYSNHGNALHALGYTQKAIEAYNKAIEISDRNKYAIYGLGIIRYNNGEYDEAIELFTKYTSIEKKDPDGWAYLGLCWLYGENDAVKAKGFLDKALALDSSDLFAVESMAQYYMRTGAHEKAAQFYENTIIKNPDNYGLLCSAAAFHYNSGNTDNAVKYADQAILADASSPEAYSIKAQAYLLNTDMQKAADTIDTMIRQKKDDPKRYSIAGDIYFSFYEYKLASEYYEMAVRIDPLYVKACIGKIGSLYYRKRYTACLAYALEAEKKFDNTDIIWYIGDVYSALRDSEKAIEYYKKALGKLSGNPNLLLSLGWEHYYNGDFQQAADYADKVLENDKNNEAAKNLRSSAGKRLVDISDQAAEFIESNYMYFKSNDEYVKLKQQLQQKGNAGIEDICRLFGSVYKEGDMFSFILYDDYYRQYRYMKTQKTVESKSLDQDITYIRISSFAEKTANEFLDVIDNIQDPAGKYLVIDLRGNSGGDTNSGCNILDFLLPDCVACNLIYKNGYSSSYYSDDEYIGFRHIYILTDENSASCSELVTLGLKTYLDNVTVIGARTFGKGVGQIGFEDKERELAIFVVNHYWNVREVNIMDKGIEPDISMAASDTEEYLEEVRRQIAAMK